MLQTVDNCSLHLDSVVRFPLPVVGFLKYGYLKHWRLLDEVCVYSPKTPNDDSKVIFRIFRGLSRRTFEEPLVLHIEIS